MAKHKVSMFPEPIEVPDEDVPVLRAQGLLEEGAGEHGATVPDPNLADSAPGPEKGPLPLGDKNTQLDTDEESK